MALERRDSLIVSVQRTFYSQVNDHEEDLMASTMQTAVGQVTQYSKRPKKSQQIAKDHAKKWKTRRIYIYFFYIS